MKNQKSLIKKEQLFLVFKNSSLGIMASAVNTLFLGFINRDTEKYLLVTWIILSLLIILARTALAAVFWNLFHKRQEINYKKYITLFAIGLFLSGLSLGLFIFLIPGNELSTRHLFLFLILGGMIGGAVGSYSPHKNLFYFYSVPAIVPPIITFLFSDNEVFNIIGIIFLLFIFIMSLTFQSSHKSVNHSLTIKYENKELIGFLENYKTRLEELNESLIQEISEKDLARMTLAENEKKFSDMFSKNTSIMLLVDMINGTISDANEAAVRFFGFSQEDFRKKKISDLDANQEIHDLSMISLSGQEGIKLFSFPAVVAGGQLRIIELKASPIIVNNKYYFFVIINDVTEKKEYEEKLKIYASAFENIYEGIIITDKNRNIIDVNHAFTRITGYTRAEVIGRSPSILSSGKHDKLFFRELNETVANSGFWEGEIWNKTKNNVLYPELLSIASIKDKKGNIINYVGTFTDISRLKEKETRLTNQAQFDSLTGMPNRYALNNKLEDLAVMPHSRFAVLFMDLDNFKIINDTMGHDAGDLLLQAVALRLKNTLRLSDFIARMGGDEFLAIIENSNRQDLTKLAAKIIDSFKTPFLLQGQETIVSTSIGIAIYPEHGDNIAAIIKNADSAMYTAKTKSKNCFYIYGTDSNMKNEVV